MSPALTLLSMVARTPKTEFAAHTPIAGYIGLWHIASLRCYAAKCRPFGIADSGLASAQQIFGLAKRQY